MSVLVIGTLALDTIETPWEKVEQVLGGSATYISLAARQMTSPVGVVSVIGKDFPEAYKKIFKSSDLDLSGVQSLEHVDTFAWGGRYRKDINIRDTVFTRLNALAEFRPVVPDAFKRSRVFCFGNLSPEIQMSTVHQIDRKGFIACDTMNYWIQNMPKELKEVLKCIDCLLINDEEAREITGEYNLLIAARQIFEMGPKILIIKKGEHGALLFVEDKIFVTPGFLLEKVEDPTGAGDAFLGAFAGSLAHESMIGLDALKRAIIYGSTVASFCVESLGPTSMVSLTKTAIEERIGFFKGLTEWPRI